MNLMEPTDGRLLRARSVSDFDKRDYDTVHKYDSAPQLVQQNNESSAFGTVLSGVNYAVGVAKDFFASTSSQALPLNLSSNVDLVDLNVEYIRPALPTGRNYGIFTDMDKSKYSSLKVSLHAFGTWRQEKGRLILMSCVVAGIITTLNLKL